MTLLLSSLNNKFFLYDVFSSSINRVSFFFFFFFFPFLLVIFDNASLKHQVVMFLLVENTLLPAALKKQMFPWYLLSLILNRRYG